MQAKHYYEAHVTIEPVFDRDAERAAAIGKAYGFKLADLLMQKRTADTPERSKNDTFMTAHGTLYADISERTGGVVNALQAFGFKVWRYKIEDTLIDSRIKDEMELLT